MMEQEALLKVVRKFADGDVLLLRTRRRPSETRLRAVRILGIGHGNSLLCRLGADTRGGEAVVMVSRVPRGAVECRIALRRRLKHGCLSDDEWRKRAEFVAALPHDNILSLSLSWKPESAKAKK